MTQQIEHVKSAFQLAKRRENH